MKRNHVTGNAMFKNINGEVVKRTIFYYPYSYDAFVIYKNGYNKKKDSVIYSDRLIQMNYELYDSCCMQVFNNTGHAFDGRKPEDIERFLSLYLGRNIKLTGIEQACNVSNGYPYWIFYYRE